MVCEYDSGPCEYAGPLFTLSYYLNERGMSVEVGVRVGPLVVKSNSFEDGHPAHLIEMVGGPDEEEGELLLCLDEIRDRLTVDAAIAAGLDFWIPWRSGSYYGKDGTGYCRRSQVGLKSLAPGGGDRNARCICFDYSDFAEWKNRCSRYRRSWLAINGRTETRTQRERERDYLWAYMDGIAPGWRKFS